MSYQIARCVCVCVVYRVVTYYVNPAVEAATVRDG